jgi:hypothetical protein
MNKTAADVRQSRGRSHADGKSNKNVPQNSFVPTSMA